MRWIEAKQKNLLIGAGIWLFLLFFGKILGEALPRSLGALFLGLNFMATQLLQIIAVLIGIGLVIWLIVFIHQGMKGRE